MILSVILCVVTFYMKPDLNVGLDHLNPMKAEAKLEIRVKTKQGQNSEIQMTEGKGNLLL